MKRLLLLGLLLAASSPAWGQSVVAPCVTTTNGSFQNCNRVTSTNPLPVTNTPGGTQNVNLNQVLGSALSNTNPVLVAPTTLSPSATAAAASNSVLKASAGTLYSLTVTIGATTGWVMVFDATALPSNGATGASLKWCFPVNSDGTKGGVDKEWAKPLSFATGIVVGFSSTACNSLTASSTAFFYGTVQ